MATEAEVPYTRLTHTQRRAIIEAPFPPLLDVWRGQGWGGACTDRLRLKDGPPLCAGRASEDANLSLDYFDTSDVDF